MFDISINPNTLKFEISKKYKNYNFINKYQNMYISEIENMMNLNFLSTLQFYQFFLLNHQYLYISLLMQALLILPYELFPLPREALR